jgi:hypothetical protein
MSAYTPPYIGKQTAVPNITGGAHRGYQVNTYGPDGWLIDVCANRICIPRTKSLQLDRLLAMYTPKGGH